MPLVLKAAGHPARYVRDPTCGLRHPTQAFFADIYGEAVHAAPAPGHRALGALREAGRLHRHYTLNIDGLAGEVGMDTWHPEHNPGGEAGCGAGAQRGE